MKRTTAPRLSFACFKFLPLLLTLAAGVASAGAADDAQARASRENPACVAAQRYNAFVANRDQDKIGSIFADKVDYVGPDGKARQTKAEVAALYSAFKAPPKGVISHTRIVNLVSVGDRECLMEFEGIDADTNKPYLMAIDHFRVDAAGKVDFFRPFFQSAAIVKNPMMRQMLATPPAAP